MSTQEEMDIKNIDAHLMFKFCTHLTGKIDVYIKLRSDKFVKISDETGGLKEILRKYINKGVQSVYIGKKNFHLIKEAIKEGLSKEQVLKSETFHVKSLEFLAKSYNFLKQLFSKLQIDDLSFDLADSANRENLNLISGIKNISHFYDKFHKHCPKEFMRVLMTSYLAVAILENLDIRTDKNIQNLSLAILLSDLTLEFQDFLEIERVQKEENNKSLPERVLNHPLRMSKSLQESKSALDKDVLRIILEHHELPDGTGFPQGLKADEISPLSSIYIVARHFMENLLETQMDINSKQSIVDKLSATFNDGYFKQSMSSLRQVLSTES